MFKVTWVFNGQKCVSAVDARDLIGFQIEHDVLLVERFD